MSLDIISIELNENGKFGYTDVNGNILCDYKYDDVANYYDGFARVKFNNKWGFIDTKFVEVCS
jgi:hypothetical protein